MSVVQYLGFNDAIARNVLAFHFHLHISLGIGIIVVQVGGEEVVADTRLWRSIDEAMTLDARQSPVVLAL